VQLLLIDGAWQPSATSGTYETHNPFTGEVASQAAAATSGDVVRAVGAAERAFPAWASLPPNERRRILWAAAERIEARAE
jgi:benzaldehyde dehydrogenase (NAD)